MHQDHATGSGDIQNGWIRSGQPSCFYSVDGEVWLIDVHKSALLRLHCNGGYGNAPPCYVLRKYFLAPNSCLNGKVERLDTLELDVDKRYRRVGVARSVLQGVAVAVATRNGSFPCPCAYHISCTDNFVLLNDEWLW